MKQQTWQRLMDVIAITTALGMAFLIVFAMMQTSERTQQIRQQIRANMEVLNILRELQRETDEQVVEHRESALRQHCATAQLVARSDGEVTDDEGSLLRLACNH